MIDYRTAATHDDSIQTFGYADTVMLLFENQDGDLKYDRGDDENGIDQDAKITNPRDNGRE